ncbi:MAG: DUF1972 domain-containing protein [Halioglobus sp.]
MTRKVAIIGTVGVPAKYGGFETLAENLTQYLAHNYEITVYCCTESYEEKLSSYNNAKLRYVPFNANGIQSIVYDSYSLLNAIRYADTVLVLGVSGCVVLPFVKFFSRRRIVVNIDGLEWKRDKWNTFAKWFLRFSEKLAVHSADSVVTDNKVIQDYVQREYGIGSSLIAYGGDQATSLSISEESALKYPFLGGEYAFSVCRIEPENNLHLILEAVKQNASLAVVIVGNWDSSEYGRDLRATYSMVEGIHLLDPIYNQNILDQIRSNCCLYLHGHSAGGTNPSLVEAMYLGLPLFAFGVDYNRETTECAAQYFSSAEELAGMLAALDEQALQAIGEAMAEIARRRYSWDFVANQYAALF